MDEFLFNLDGLIAGEFFQIKTNSKKVIIKVIELMDEEEKT